MREFKRKMRSRLFVWGVCLASIFGGSSVGGQMDSKSSKFISLDDLVQISDYIVKVRWSGNTHSAFPPQNPLDGVLLQVREVLWASAAISSSTEKNHNLHLSHEYSESNTGLEKMRYNTPIPLNHLFGETGLSADPAILFLTGKDFSSFRIACPGAWESVDHIDKIRAAIKRVKRDQSMAQEARMLEIKKPVHLTMPMPERTCFPPAKAPAVLDKVEASNSKTVLFFKEVKGGWQKHGPFAGALEMEIALIPGITSVEEVLSHFQRKYRVDLIKNKAYEVETFPFGRVVVIDLAAARVIPGNSYIYILPKESASGAVYLGPTAFMKFDWPKAELTIP